MPVIDETGHRYNSLTVLQRGPNNAYGDARWYCRCDCGKETLVCGYQLRRGDIKSCGCSRKGNGMNDLTNQRFGKLIAIKPLERRSSEGQVFWLCQCDCGEIVEVKSGSLVNGYTKSCGCIRSRGENRIIELLTQAKIKFQREKSFQDLTGEKRLRYDFAILDNNFNIIRLIEFDGNQHTDVNNPWFSINNQKRDIQKNEYAKAHNIPLVRIPYSKRDTMTLEDILSDKWRI